MLIRKIVLQPINLANAPKRSTDKIEQAKRGCDAQQCEGHQGYVNCAAGAEGQRDGEGRGGGDKAIALHAARRWEFHYATVS